MTPRLASWPLFLLWLLLLLVAELTRPLFPVDETRYASVAWEMWLRGDWLVPHLNGEPYSHKPPLYFWLINSAWLLLGVHEWVLRLVMPLVLLGVLFSSRMLARQLWPDDRLATELVPWLLFGSTLLCAFFTWVQFDLLLVLMTLLALVGLLHARQAPLSGWLLYGLASGLGVLSKGPVILLFVVPVALLAPVWCQVCGDDRSWWRWYAGWALAVLLAALVALAWAWPAAQAGDEAYRAALLWGQTAERVVAAFDHARPPWWYLPWLPLLLAPWALLPWVWSRLRDTGPGSDAGLRFCLIWLVCAVLLLSLVSGKQLKYLLPVLPAATLYLARACSRTGNGVIDRRPWLLALGLLCAAAVLLLLPRFEQAAPWLADVHPLWAGLLLITAAALLWLPPCPLTRQVQRLTLLSVWLVLLLHLAIYRAGAPAYDLRPAARFIAAAQHAGHRVASLPRYHGQFGFLGRLTEPLVQLDDASLSAWVQQHPHGYVVAVTRDTLQAYPDAALSQPYRSGYLGIWTGDVVLAHLDVFRERDTRDLAPDHDR